MPRFVGDKAFSHDRVPRAGILLSNLGTPDAPTTSAVRRYLAEFLWDPRVVEIPRPLWWLILHGVVLRTRPRRSAEAYRQVWSDRGSPLLVNSLEQRDAIAAELRARHGERIEVALGMRYGTPSIADGLTQLRDAGVQRLLVLPLYPQYSGTTTASTFDAVANELARWRWLPELRFVPSYHDHAGYIGALAASIREHRARHGAGERLLFSFHGLPRRNLTEGDPYHCQCLKTARLVAQTLELADDDWLVSFQSRLGRAEWLRPYTDETLVELARGGTRIVDVVCPGFAADCLETLEEIAIRNGEDFVHAGGETLRYIPALNTRPDHIAFLCELAVANMHGWPEIAGANDDAARDAIATAERARAAGAAR